MSYRIEYSGDAVGDIEYFKKYERVTIIDGIDRQLSHEPLREVRNRKLIRENALNAPWELRIGSYRIFYSVDGSSEVVTVLAVGWKEHNTLYIRGKEYKL